MMMSIATTSAINPTSVARSDLSGGGVLGLYGSVHEISTVSIASLYDIEPQMGTTQLSLAGKVRISNLEDLQSAVLGSKRINSSGNEYISSKASFMEVKTPRISFLPKVSHIRT